MFSMAIEERLAALQGDEQLLQQYHRQLADVTTMRDQLAGGGDAASGTLSVALLKAQLLDVERGLPAELSLQLPASSQDGTVQLADLDALKAVLTDAISRLQASVDEQTQSISQVSYGMDLVDQTNDPVTLRLTGLQTEVQDLQSQIEAQTSKKEQLTLTRDLAWDSYNTLARKEAELRIANDLPASEVRFAAPAATPIHPVSPKTNLILAAGAAGGWSSPCWRRFSCTSWAKSLSSADAAGRRLCDGGGIPDLLRQALASQAPCTSGRSIASARLRSTTTRMRCRVRLW